MVDYYFDRYRRLSLMFSNGIHISDVLKKYDIVSLYIYGYGEMGRIVIGDILETDIKIDGIIDRDAKGDSVKFTNRENAYELKIVSTSDLLNDDVPILITPTNLFDEIADSLIKIGVNSSRLYSLDIILRWGCAYINGISEDGYMSKRICNEFLITGANFYNRGSQAMCMTMVNEIRRKYEDAQIWVQGLFLSDEDWREANKTFKMFFLPTDESLMSGVMPHLKAVFDISGYALGSNWSHGTIDRFKRRIELAEKYSIPIYLMPQSFGPFDFDEDEEDGLLELLSGVTVIFAREEEGYRNLKKRYSLSNVIKTEDMVLQHKRIDASKIYVNHKMENYILKTENNVAIIPNSQNVRHGESNDVVKLYQCAVDLLIKMGKNVYIISHSDDDAVCRKIMNPFWNEGNVYLYGKKFDCVGFEDLIKNFQFAVASRYHSVVHAYRQGVPCVVLGWADKYQELTDSFEQNEYVFDVREEVGEKVFLDGINALSRCWEYEKKRIENAFDNIQRKKTCFDYIVW